MSFTGTVRFHLAFPVNDLVKTRAFYVEGLGCELGRESAYSLILGLGEHQLVAHLTAEPLEPQNGIYPRHFGLVFELESDWEALLERAQRHQLTFYQQPKHRFPGSPLEHRTFFLADPFHNLLEFKFYRHSSAILGQRELTQVGDRG
ncbi:VOC family protein [Leptolyngbya sp. FACHB-261]|uniref:VOC family protein n=1 Tax=Leptolyngbya sp. FACHB-261 TaxID=2692806 RepID=UPI0016880B65|nr:VOC family protein [Leptolyngbya sp. FACHB-261]MBD2100433.1 VOC family protein [Leptolyngbya sp. FACHB-261]